MRFRKRSVADADKMYARYEVVAKIARLIHQRSGHVDDHEGEVGGCHRAAEEIYGMLPPDLVSARVDLEALRTLAEVCIAERDSLRGQAAQQWELRKQEVTALEADLATLRAENERLRAALEAAGSILWMAENYAEGGGSGGPEMRDYREASALVFSALEAARRALEAGRR